MPSGQGSSQIAMGQESPKIEQGNTGSGGSERSLRSVMAKPSIAREVKKVRETQRKLKNVKERKVKNVKARHGDLKKAVEIE